MGKHKLSPCTGDKHYSMTEVFHAIGRSNLVLEKPEKFANRENIKFDGYDVHPQSLRYMTFWQKGTVCACCGRRGSYFTLDRENAAYEGMRRHFNLWSEDGMLMTKDHIIPKSAGGRDCVSNLQTMCRSCNAMKGSNIL